MGNFFSDLFSPGKTESSTQQLNKYTKEQQDLLNALTSRASGGLSTGAEVYPKQMYAEQNPYETAFLNSGSEAAKNQVVREQAIQNAISGKPGYDINPEVTKQYWAQTMEPYYDKQERALKEQYGTGYFSGGRDIALGEFESGKSAAYAALQYQDEIARRQAIENALNRQAQVAPGAWTSNEALMQTSGTLARDIAEKQVASDYMRWLSGEPVEGVVNQAYNPYQTLAMQILGISPYVYQTNQTATGSGLGYGLLNSLLKSGGEYAGAQLGNKIGG